MTEESFLIAHKVRGQPAFDVAIKMTIGEEQWWVLPTTGHRAYPFGYLPLSCLFHKDEEYPDGGVAPVLTPSMTTAPSDLRDFYSAHDDYRGRRLSNPTSVPKQKSTLNSVLDSL